MRPMAAESNHRNERLRTAIAKSGQTIDSVAQHLAVDRKTVERWIGGRTPPARYRWGVGALLGEDHTYLWPEDDHRNRSSSAADQEIITFYPSRATVPADLWKRFFARAAEHIDVLVYAA